MHPIFLPIVRLIVAPALIATGAFAIQAGEPPQSFVPLPTQGIPQGVPQSQAQTQGNGAPNSSDGSLNWAGYVAQQKGEKYTAVSGGWTVPEVETTQAGTADATWIGIGGVVSQDLIQVGTQALTNGNGDTVYEAWYETLPNYSTTLPLAVHPGDVVSASIDLQSPGEWLLSIADKTTGEHYSTAIHYDSTQSSAEWIEEMVSNGNYTFRPLDDFGSVNFNEGLTVENGDAETISQAGAEPLEMVNGTGRLLAAVSGLDGNGSGFTVARTDAPTLPAAASHTVTIFYYGGGGSGTPQMSQQSWRLRQDGRFEHRVPQGNTMRR